MGVARILSDPWPQEENVHMEKSRLVSQQSVSGGPLDLGVWGAIRASQRGSGRSLESSRYFMQSEALGAC